MGKRSRNQSRKAGQPSFEDRIAPYDPNAPLEAADLLVLAEEHDIDASTIREWLAEGVTQPQAHERVTNIYRARTENARAAPQQLAEHFGGSQTMFREGITQPRSFGPDGDYSVIRGIRAALDGGGSPELDVSQDLETKFGIAKRSNRSFLIESAAPLPLTRTQTLHAARRRELGLPEVPSHPSAALTTSGTTSGEELVFIQPGSFIEMLRNRMVTTRLGATFLPGLQGDVAFPRQTGAGTLEWRAENPGSDQSLADLATGQVVLSPKDAQASTSYTRRMLQQSAIDVEQLVRNDFAAIGALGLDFAALHGPGTNAPTGIYGQTGVNPHAFSGAPTWDDIVAMETLIMADNADVGVMAYATTPEARGNLKTVEKATGTAQFIWQEGEPSVDGSVNGYKAFASNQFRKDLGVGTNEHGIIFGVWDQLLIGEWGAIEIMVDPYTLGGQALVVVRLFMHADVALRNPEAFCIGTALVPA